jgi:hypothetical protein
LVRKSTDIHYRDFHYHGLIIRVESTDPSALRWLEEFLCPAFDIVETSVFACSVFLRVDTPRYEAILRRGASPEGGRKAVFALESSVIFLPVWLALSPDLVLFDEECRVFYGVDASKSRVCIVTAAHNLAARVALMRVIREYAMNYVQRTGGFVIHGAAFVAGERGIIVAGPKKAGKTSLLIHALRHRTVTFAANDRVLVYFNGTVPLWRGMPTIVTLRQQTVQMFSHLQRRLRESSYHHQLSLLEAANGSHRHPRPEGAGTFTLSPAQFCKLLQVRPTTHGKVWRLVFPRVTGAGGSIQLTRLSAPAAAFRLSQALFRHGSTTRPSALFACHDDGLCTATIDYERLCLRLTSSVHCYDCQLGVQAYRGEYSAAKFLNEIIG